MIGKLVWKKSGDEIKFVPTFPDLLAYYVECLNTTDSNTFSLQSTKYNSSCASQLKKCIESIAEISNKIPFEIDNWSGDIFDQEYLNLLHRQWVYTGIKYPTLPLLLRKMGNLDVTFRDINRLLHQFESSFSYSFVNYAQDPYQIENIFGADVLGFDQPNLSIGFDNLGRSSYEKFHNFDNNALDSDTNNFKKLSGLVNVSLNRPIGGSPPAEYVNWCKLHDIPVVGKTLSLGNIVDLDLRLTDIRKILVRNVNEQDDRFSFEICAH